MGTAVAGPMHDISGMRSGAGEGGPGRRERSLPWRSMISSGWPGGPIARVEGRSARRCSRSPSLRVRRARAGPSGAGRACWPSGRGISSGRIRRSNGRWPIHGSSRRLGKLRGQYPAGRVGWLRFRSEVAEGPYTGENAPLAAIIDALAGPAAEAEVRRDAPETVRGPLTRSRVEVAVGVTPAGPRRASAADAPREGRSSGEIDAGEESAAGFYMAVLLAIALLMASVEQGARAGPPENVCEEAAGAGRGTGRDRRPRPGRETKPIRPAGRRNERVPACETKPIPGLRNEANPAPPAAVRLRAPARAGTPHGAARRRTKGDARVRSAQGEPRGVSHGS